MDSKQFDQLVRSLASVSSRRRAFTWISGPPLAAALSPLLAQESRAAAKRHKPEHRQHDERLRAEKKHKKKKKKKHHTPVPPSSPPASPPPPPPPATGTCIPDTHEQTCAGTCGSVLNNCQTAVDCGDCPGGQTCCNGTCVSTSSDSNNCGTCGLVCPGGGVCCNANCETLDTPTNCGTCGHACPGYMQPNTNVTCNQGTCTFSCQGENYDLDGDPSTGCETADSPTGNHVQSSAVSLGNQSCADTPLSFSGTILSDARTHAFPAIVGFDTTTGSAPDWYVIHATGGLCQDDLSVALTITEGTPTCYHLRVITNKGQFDAQVGNNGMATITQSDAYSDGTDIHFQISKTCGTTVLEKASYSAQFHL